MKGGGFKDPGVDCSRLNAGCVTNELMATSCYHCDNIAIVVDGTLIMSMT